MVTTWVIYRMKPAILFSKRKILRFWITLLFWNVVIFLAAEIPWPQANSVGKIYIFYYLTKELQNSVTVSFSKLSWNQLLIVNDSLGKFFFGKILENDVSSMFLFLWKWIRLSRPIKSYLVIIQSLLHTWLKILSLQFLQRLINF